MSESSQPTSTSLSYWPTVIKTLQFCSIVFALWLLVFTVAFDQPQALFTANWPIILIAFFSAAIANATAVGGGFIFLPLFTFFYDLTAIQSLKLALSTQAFGMTSGALSWPRHLINWRYACFASVGGAIGMALGTFVWTPSNHLIHVYFGYTSILVGVALMIEAMLRDNQYRQAHQLAANTESVVFLLVCVIGGLITAWVSIGIGEIVAMWMLFKARYRIATSVATGVVVLAVCSVLGLAFHTSLGGIAWHYLAFTSLGVILGGRAGAKIGALLAGAAHGNSDVNCAPQSNSNTTTQPRLNSERPLKLVVAVIILLDGLVVLWLKT